MRSKCRGKCNCGKKAINEFLIVDKKVASTIKLCFDCSPKFKYNNIIKIN